MYVRHTAGGNDAACDETRFPQHAMRVFVCSDIRLYRDGLAGALARSPALEVAGTAKHFEDCLRAVAAGSIEVVLFDALGEGTELAVRALHAASPTVRVVVLTAPDGEQDLMTLAEAGVAAFVTRDDGVPDLLELLSGLRRGDARIPPRTGGMLLRHVAALAAERRVASRVAEGHQRLTRRELEILALVAEGLSNKQIGSRLQIELPTVKNHIHNILSKLEVDRRSQAVAVVRAHGLIGVA